MSQCSLLGALGSYSGVHRKVRPNRLREEVLSLYLHGMCRSFVILLRYIWKALKMFKWYVTNIGAH